METNDRRDAGRDQWSLLGESGSFLHQPPSSPAPSPGRGASPHHGLCHSCFLAVTHGGAVDLDLTQGERLHPVRDGDGDVTALHPITGDGADGSWCGVGDGPAAAKSRRQEREAEIREHRRVGSRTDDPLPLSLQSPMHGVNDRL